MRFAALFHDDILFVVQDDLFHTLDDLAEGYISVTPVTALVEHIYRHRLGRDAHRILRKPIYVNYQLSLFERAYLRVQAKRTKFSENLPVFTGAKSQTLSLSQEIEIFLKEAQEGMSFVDSRNRFYADRAIRCEIYGSSQLHGQKGSCSQEKNRDHGEMHSELITWATNRGGLVRPLHAELVALRTFELQNGAQAKLSGDIKIHVTLKPCKMCAQLIVAMAKDPLRLQIHYQTPDLGRNSRYTILGRLNIEQQTETLNLKSGESIFTMDSPHRQGLST